MTRFLALCLLVTAGLFSTNAMAEEAAEWEYLVVSYGTTYFSNPLTDLAPEIASRSKILLFSDLGLTLPNEAVSLQRNMDVLGRFGWELIGVIGAIGGDQQLLFKRHYDAERSASEAARISEERQALIAEFVSSQTATQAPSRLIDLDRVERAQATEARNARDAQIVESIIDAAFITLDSSTLINREATGSAYGPTSRPDVTANVTIDVTGAALVGPGQYREGLVTDEIQQLRVALLANGLSEPARSFGSCPSGTSEVAIRVTAVIQHDGTEVSVFSRYYSSSSKLCMKDPD